MQYISRYASPIGMLTLASDEEHLFGLWMQGQKYEGQGLEASAVVQDGAAPLVRARAWLDGYFAGENPPISGLPLAPRGSAFRQMIWEMLCRIPRGQFTTYGALARSAAARLGRESMSAQAVGGAVGHNPISIIIPCHRVLGADGSLTGYAGGVEKKRWLLRHEGMAFDADGKPDLSQMMGFDGKHW